MHACQAPAGQVQGPDLGTPVAAGGVDRPGLADAAAERGRAGNGEDVPVEGPDGLRYRPAPGVHRYLEGYVGETASAPTGRWSVVGLVVGVDHRHGVAGRVERPPVPAADGGLRV